MITIDKLDKIGAEGVAKELTEKFGQDVGDATAVWLESIVGELEVPVELMSVFAAVESRFPGRLRFDPTLVRGMGYYTGAIFEIEHPGSGSSIGGGGRYDGMVGRWLGTDVPAVGISIGFERVVDLVEAAALKNHLGGIVLVLDNTEPRTLANAVALQSELIAQNNVVRLENRPKKLNLLLESLAENGFDRFATVTEDSTSLESLQMKALS
jgi:histidyl-tRNA synthetase